MPGFVGAHEHPTLTAVFGGGHGLVFDDGLDFRQFPGRGLEGCFVGGPAQEKQRRFGLADVVGQVAVAGRLAGLALGLGYEDLKTIEMAQFAKSIADGEQGEPGFAEALAVADVLDAIQRSWDSESWEDVKTIRKD